MIRVQHLLLLSCCLVFWACERVVEIEERAPSPVEYCSVDTEMIGSWTSDSVQIITEVDTIDSSIVNVSPTLFYDLFVACDDQKELVLSYTNFAGVKTEDVRSSNFESFADRLYAYNAFDSVGDTLIAGFKMRFAFRSDSLCDVVFTQEPNPGQRSTYFLFLKRTEGL